MTSQLLRCLLLWLDLCIDQDSTDEYHSLFYQEDIGGPHRAPCCSGKDLFDSDVGDVAEDLEATSTCIVDTPEWEGPSAKERTATGGRSFFWLWLVCCGCMFLLNDWA